MKHVNVLCSFDFFFFNYFCLASLIISTRPKLFSFDVFLMRLHGQSSNCGPEVL